ncbi:hypothetical protein FB45DRAFT_1090943 [Roridomyces roridus]|uniref:Uncharacterized protein n=1 Tax=Roridomyces roridus TaxID=1738132 RepID=A0AAD7BJ19_9AGAR|nr:hypothetical protein FB45DRAFT_1090943 [Roridomyces roridus]
MLWTDDSCSTKLPRRMGASLRLNVSGESIVRSKSFKMPIEIKVSAPSRFTAMANQAYSGCPAMGDTRTRTVIDSAAAAACGALQRYGCLQTSSNAKIALETTEPFVSLPGLRSTILPTIREMDAISTLSRLSLASKLQVCIPTLEFLESRMIGRIASNATLSHVSLAIKLQVCIRTLELLESRRIGRTAPTPCGCSSGAIKRERTGESPQCPVLHAGEDVEDVVGLSSGIDLTRGGGRRKSEMGPHDDFSARGHIFAPAGRQYAWGNTIALNTDDK